MVVRNLRKVRPFIWIPPIYTTNYKVTVERLDGTIDDITDIIVNLKIEDGITTGIGSFEFQIPNPNETYSNVWTGMEIFRYYSDYATTATTLRFRGRIEKPSKRNNNVLVTGRGEALFVQGQDVHKEYVDEDGGSAMKDLFDTYGEGRFDTTEINVNTGTLITATYLETPFWDVIESICNAMIYDCYISADLVVKFFPAGSIQNTTDAIVHEYNLYDVGDFAPDIQFIKNRIRVIGGTIDGVQVRYTANDTPANQTKFGIKKETVNDDGITTFQAAKELGNSLLALKKDPPITGEVTSFLLATIQPGEQLRLSSPQDNLQPGFYIIRSYKHEISDEGLFTTVTINKEQRRISHVLKDRIQIGDKRTDSQSNVDDLDFTEIELYNVEIGFHSNTEISDGILKLQTGESSGYWISPAYGPNDESIFDKIKIDIAGDNLPGTTIDITYDDGNSWITVARRELYTLGAGEQIKVRLSLTTGSQVDSMGVQYSLM